MQPKISRRTFVAAGAASVALGATPAVAQGASDKPIRWIVYQSPGGLIDGSTRAIQPFLKNLGFDSTVDYVRGASGRIARTQVVRAAPDGFTIMTEASPEEVLGEVVYNAEYKVADLQPIFGWFVNAFNLYVAKTSPIKTMADFIAEGKKRAITVGTIGKGGPSHLQLALLKSRLGLNLQLVHFNGGAPAYAALSGGHVEAAIGGSSSVRWADTLTFLGVFKDVRDTALPQIATMKEMGHDIPSINEVIYVHTGPGVPAARVQALTAAFTKAFADPEAVAAQKKLGVDVTPLSPDDLKKLLTQMNSLVNEYKGELAG